MEHLIERLAQARFAARPEVPAFDASAIFSRLQDEGIALLLVPFLRALGVSLPPEWDRFYYAEAALEMNRRRELERVTTAFAESNIPLVLVKGTPLAYGYYDHPAHRPRLDTDALVRLSQRSDTEALLASLGYRRLPSPGSERFLGQTMFSRRDELGETQVWDIHWEISARKFLSRRLTVEEWIERAISLPALAGARTLPPAESLFLCALHPLLHHPGERRLLWDHDLALLARAADGNRLAELSERTGTGRILRWTIETAHSRWGLQVPPAVVDGLPAGEPDPESPILKPRTWFDDLKWDLRELPGRERLGHLAQIAFPPVDFLLHRFDLADTPANRALLPVLFALRGARGLSRRLPWR